MPWYEHVGDRENSATYWPVLTFDTTMATGNQNHSTPSNKLLPTIHVDSRNLTIFQQLSFASHKKLRSVFSGRSLLWLNSRFNTSTGHMAIAQPDMPFLYRYVAEYCPQLELFQIIEPHPSRLIHNSWPCSNSCFHRSGSEISSVGLRANGELPVMPQVRNMVC